MLDEQSPLEPGTFSKGGINRQPMTPRPDFIPAPLGVLTPNFRCEEPGLTRCQRSEALSESQGNGRG
jgi:hypothetical protein